MAGDLITAIVNSIDQRKPGSTNVGLGVALSLLSLGLFLIPAIGPIAGVSTASIAAANAGVAAIKAAPAVLQSLFPPGRKDRPQQNEADIASVENVKVTSMLRANIQRGLQLVQGIGQTDVSTFLALAGSGQFSSSIQEIPKPSVKVSPSQGQPQDRIEPLLTAYTTYAVSTTLVQSGWHAILLPGVNPEGITNGTSPYPAWAGNHDNDDDLDCSDYNEVGQCSGTYWWYSEAQNSAYVLQKGKDEDSTGLLNNILSAGWSTGQLLFENAAICEIQGFLRGIPTIDPSSIVYTTVAGQAGFQFNGPLAGLEPDDFRTIDPSVPTFFLPFDGAGLTHLRQQSQYAELFHHPTDADLWSFNNQDVDFSCISQLDVYIATVWGDNWM
ncbi:MAG: hypothetical protein Q9226_005555 [Calogaya cf. arnoldii]